MNKQHLIDLIEECQRYCPSATKKAIEYYQGDDKFKIVAVMVDGGKLLYDSLLKTVRYYPPRDLEDSDRILDENKWRVEFSLKLNRTMIKEGMNQLWLSELSGVSPHTISSYLNCKSTPSAYNIHRLAKALGCSETYLTNFEEV